MLVSLLTYSSILKMEAIFLFYTSLFWSTRWLGRLGRCASSRGVAGSGPDAVAGFFNWPSPSGCAVALWSTRVWWRWVPGDFWGVFFFLLFLVGWDWVSWYCGHYWPVLPAPNDWWWWLWRNWWNEDCRENRSTRRKPATLPTRSPTWRDPG
jgi:hypothetical protein